MAPPRRFHRRKFCRFCADKVGYIDFKDLKVLKHYVSERGKIVPRRITGTCAKHQRDVKVALMQARHIALLPYVQA